MYASNWRMAFCNTTKSTIQFLCWVVVFMFSVSRCKGQTNQFLLSALCSDPTFFFFKLQSVFNCCVERLQIYRTFTLIPPPRLHMVRITSEWCSGKSRTPSCHLGEQCALGGQVSCEFCMPSEASGARRGSELRGAHGTQWHQRRGWIRNRLFLCQRLNIQHTVSHNVKTSVLMTLNDFDVSNMISTK